MTRLMVSAVRDMFTSVTTFIEDLLLLLLLLRLLLLLSEVVSKTATGSLHYCHLQDGSVY